jgi:hypothetical protein
VIITVAIAAIGSASADDGHGSIERAVRLLPKRLEAPDFSRLAPH